MAYTVRYSLGNIVINDGELDTSNTALNLPGRNYSGYGAGIDQNFLSLLENFASNTGNGPYSPIPGQLWFDSANTQLKVNASKNDISSWRTLVFDGSDISANTVKTNNFSSGSSAGTIIGEWSIQSGSVISGKFNPHYSETNQLLFQSSDGIKGLGSNVGYSTTEGANITFNSSLTLTGGCITKNVMLVGLASNASGITAITAGAKSINSPRTGGTVLAHTTVEATIHNSLIANGVYVVDTKRANVQNMHVRSNLYVANYVYGEVGDFKTITANTIDGKFLGTVAGPINVSGAKESELIYANVNAQADSHSSLRYVSNSAANNTTAILDSDSDSGDNGTLIIGNGSGFVKVGTIIPPTSKTGALKNTWTIGNLIVGTGGNVTTTKVTTGGNTITGDLVGSWSLNGKLAGTWTMAPSSTLDVRNGTLQSKTLDAGGVGINGTVNGAWALTAGSSLDISKGTFYLANLNAGSINTQGTVTGNWSLGVGSRLNVTSGAFICANLTTGANTTAGTITGQWILTTGSRLEATYADLAERFAADDVYDAGTVVELGGTHEITAVKEELSDEVFGVISDTAAYLMNGRAGNDKTHPPIAMSGRVQVKVIGKVKKNDRLVSAGNGMARSAKEGEATATNVIGKALENKFTDTHGTVLAVVSVNLR